MGMQECRKKADPYNLSDALRMQESAIMPTVIARTVATPSRKESISRAQKRTGLLNNNQKEGKKQVRKEKTANKKKRNQG